MSASAVPDFDDGAVFRSLFDASPDALLLVDQKGTIGLANPAALELLGYSRDELIGLPVDALVPEAVRSRHAAYRDAYAAQPRKRPMGTQQMDLVAKRRDGSEVMVEIALSPLQDHGLPYVVAAIRDMGAYPRVKQALQRARYAEFLAQFGRQAVDARESLIELVPAIAAEALRVETAKVLMLEPNGHEFRIAAGVGLLPEERIGDRLPNEPGSPSGYVVAEGKPVLCDYAQEQRFKIPAHYLHAGMLRRTLDQRIAITLSAEDALCMADPVQLESALLNVAINARDAMPQGGTLSFDCRSVPVLPAELAAEPVDPSPEGFVSIAVSDSGEGMSEAVKERAFEPFFTTKEMGRGTGLGLSTVYGFARQSHGAVGLASAPGAGTTVTLYLPRVEDPGIDDEGADAASQGTVPAGLRVLLVEDDAEVRGVIRNFLVTMACDVVTRASGEEALHALASDKGIGLLLTDILLGAGMRGTELAETALAQRPDLPVLLVSGYSTEVLEGLPARPLLRKPFTQGELAKAMASALNAAR